MSQNQQIVKHNPQMDRAGKIVLGQILEAVKRSSSSSQEAEVGVFLDWENGKFIARTIYQEKNLFEIATWDKLPCRVTMNFSEDEAIAIAEEILSIVKPNLVKLLSSKKASGTSSMTVIVKQGKATGITMEESQRVRTLTALDSDCL